MQAVIDDGVKPLIELDLSDGSSIKVTSNHYIWVDSGAHLNHAGWLEAGQLEPGDQLRTASGHDATVVAVRWNVGDAEVYTLTVATDHTFFVGADQVLVHNALCPGQTGIYKLAANDPEAVVAANPQAAGAVAEQLQQQSMQAFKAYVEANPGFPKSVTLIRSTVVDPATGIKIEALTSNQRLNPLAAQWFNNYASVRGWRFFASNSGDAEPGLNSFIRYLVNPKDPTITNSASVFAGVSRDYCGKCLTGQGVTGVGVTFAKYTVGGVKVFMKWPS